MATLFDTPNHRKPLPERLRPTTLAQIVGQQHLVGEGGVLSSLVKQGYLPSLIFWGPPGTGKTTLARILAELSGKLFFQLSAIRAGVKELREVIDKASLQAGKTVLFIDEIHRFNKSQQDSLLKAVEEGTLTLIGATTENPSFEVNAALLSRCRVYTLKAIEPEDLIQLGNRAMSQDDWLKGSGLILKETDTLLQLASGDARKFLSLLELAAQTAISQNLKEIDNELIQTTAQTQVVRYDKSGEQHYDIISAFIKSIRGSDPNAAIYYLARMIEGGEDPKFIARRLVILASEDIGNANPNAQLLATSTFQAVTMIGFPESRIILSQCVAYLACSAKSNASYVAINQAQALVKKTGDQPIPFHLRNAPTKFMKEEGYGKGYLYAHDHPNNFVIQEFMPETLANTTLYNPGENQAEDNQRKYLKSIWKDKYGY